MSLIKALQEIPCCTIGGIEDLGWVGANALRPAEEHMGVQEG